MSYTETVAYACICDQCAYEWTTPTLPERCAHKACKSRAWNGNQPAVRPKPAAPAIKLPARHTPTVATVIERLQHPRRIGTQCPHGFANWLTCPDCNPRR